MSDGNSNESPDQPTDPGQPNQQEAVEIDPRPRVGIGGGVDSFHHKADELEQR
ncbi:MAG: hypothetical protein QOJ20_327 [Mycobacterium sp.]|jgi:hypothetical protein|nr:hypothetical protein [Mycobacterium sp.]